MIGICFAKKYAVFNVVKSVKINIKSFKNPEH